ncbi:uncharacterized protein LOC110117177 isoform X2 [Athalia rosae]|uniref:uncharacterized protein LOC110117177 isoform X2 n=1 Tax=Athalia rosae TaxID=37344 RepID=UPI0020337D9E|nr:uncharacterized protein LOC110117177 isoform X2 [Athalia rosae]
MEFADASDASESVPAREGGSRHEQPGGSSSSSSSSSTREQQKLLKRTKSLAVISEENRIGNNRQANYYRLGEDAFRRQQLIPRAKLINRHSLKDRLSKSQQHLSSSFEVTNPRVQHRSRLTSDTYSVSDPHVSLPNFVQQNHRQNNNPDRLNILEWPEAPKRYQSVQNLDNVSGLVEVVEENWPSERNKSIDCIYTQVKRKRKEHRSLDSVLFEDDKELEYFNVLDLLPLSNVRLQFEDRTGSNNSSSRRRDHHVDSLERKFYPRELYSPKDYDHSDENYNEIGILRESNNSGNSRDPHHQREEGLEADFAEALNESKIKEVCETNGKSSNGDKICEARNDRESSLSRYANRIVNYPDHGENNKQVLILDSDEDKFRADVAVVRPVEEAEDYKSIWISDSDEPSEVEMSRRPQVMKVIDNDVTKRNRNSTVEVSDVVEVMNSIDKEVDENPVDSGHPTNDPEISSNNKTDDAKEEANVESVKSFFETKSRENREAKVVDHTEGKFERIIKETTSIFGKACNAVKGSLGFEARSESSDLGLGSESGSDTRRQSMDGVEDEVEGNGEKISSNKDENDRSALSRSFSCSDRSAQPENGPEFDHIRYKVMKSDLFSKNMFGSMKNDQAFDGLMQYLQEYSFHDLLVDNNVVIIEPVRAETVDRRSSGTNGVKTKNPSSCRIAGAIQKKSQQTRDAEKNSENQPKSPKQPTLRRHFFYHPIRVNRELIDDELPDPDTVRNVRKMFEGTLKLKTPDTAFARNCPTRKTVSMKDLTRIDDNYEGSDKADESRSSSRAKDLTKLFENQDKNSDVGTLKDGNDSPRSECKTRLIAQVFEARSGQTSPSDSGLSKHKGNRYHHNWDSGSVSSGVSSDYPDTDPGSGVQCTSSEDEDEANDEDDIDNGPSHFVSQDVLKKIRECGTSVTYYGGKVVNTCNSPLISPPITGKIIKEILKNKPRDREAAAKDYVKFRLVKSNSCDSRLELAGRLVNESRRGEKMCKKNGETGNKIIGKEYPAKSDLRSCPIMESLNIEIVGTDEAPAEPRIKNEPPIVIGLEPKREEFKEPEIFKAEFKLGKLEDTKCYANKFNNSAFNQWQVNDKIQDKKCKFGEIDFEEFEVLEDSLNSSVKKN